MALSIDANFAANYQRALNLGDCYDNKILHEIGQLHWIDDGHNLWYSTLKTADTQEYVKVWTITGKMKRTSTLAELGISLSHVRTSELKQEYPNATRNTGSPIGLDFRNEMSESIELYWSDTNGIHIPYGILEPGSNKRLSTYVDHVWVIKNRQKRILAVFTSHELVQTVIIDGMPKAGQNTIKDQVEKNDSFDDRWRVKFKNHQIVLVDKVNEIAMVLTNNGTGEYYYCGPVFWSPDNQSVIVFREKAVTIRRITLVESAPEKQTQPKLHVFPYPKPGDDILQPRPLIIDVKSKQIIQVEDQWFSNPFFYDGHMRCQWSVDSREFYFDYNQRGHQIYRILALNRTNGKVRVVAEEKTNTFIDYSKKLWRYWLHSTGELIWLSEQDGWNHLWMYDIASGQIKNKITRGSWVVRDVIYVDETNRIIWFLASGMNRDQNPYYQHLCRVRFDGREFKQLTENNGNHRVEFSSDHQCFVDTWSRIDHPLVSELRRSKDGSLICILEKANTDAFITAGWFCPETFEAKGRDGTTDIYGIILKPSNFDSSQRYPIIEHIYAGPQNSFTSIDFSLLQQMQSLAELGFILVQCDGMGTNNRGKAFHEVCWKNLKDAGFPDRIAWIRAAASTRPWMDVSRIGIYGGSAGGQSAMRAVLDHAYFYKAAVADCGCHDNRVDKLWWNEQWMGWPVDESYTRSSNVVDAAKLAGKLMLVVGEMDHNVDPASTMQAVKALQRANKDFDLLIMIGIGHGANESPYANRKRMAFFAKHLLGKELT